MPSSHIILCHPLLLPPQSFPALGSFPVSQLFTWGSQNIGVSASTSVLPMNTQDWSPLGWTGWISLQSQGLSRVFSNATVQRYQFFGTQLSSQSQLSHPYMTTGKTIAFTRRTFVGKVMSLLLNMLSRLVIIFLPRNKRLLISWLQIRHFHRHIIVASMKTSLVRSLWEAVPMCSLTHGYRIIWLNEYGENKPLYCCLYCLG